jgi:acetolactate synthase small subunit
MPGMHGTVAAVGALQRSDLLIALGTRFDDRVTGQLSSFAPLAKVIHADIDPAEISKNRVADVPIVGDCKEVILQLISLLRREHPLQIDEWVSFLKDVKRRYPTGYDEPADGSLSPQYVIKRIGEITGSDAYYAAGVGQHQMWASHYLPWELPGRWLNSGGLGTMGYCVPAAMGAKVGQPDKIVWGIDGDGCFQMTNQELATCALEGIPIKIAVINNQSLGMVRQWQTLFYQGRYSNTDLKTNRIPDFPKLAEAMGCVGTAGRDPGRCRCGDRKGELDQRRASGGGLRRAQGCDGLADGGSWHQQRRNQGCPRHGAELGSGGSVMAGPNTHTLSVLVQNKPGVLARIAGLISRRGYNIESLAVGPTESQEMSRMTLQVNVEDVVLEQITKQLNKLIEVLKVVELEETAVRRELVLVKVRATAETRSQLIEIIGLFGAKAVDLTAEIITVEATGSPPKLAALLDLLEPYGIRELVQSGLVAIGRGNRSLTDRNQRTERLKAVRTG